jgi:hypothetical protein
MHAKFELANIPPAPLAVFLKAKSPSTSTTRTTVSATDKTTGEVNRIAMTDDRVHLPTDEIECVLHGVPSVSHS